MSELSYVLELYFANEEDEAALENLQNGLSVAQARALKREWRRVLARHDPKECLRLVVYGAMRAPADGEAAWAWLDARYGDLTPYFDLVEDEPATGGRFVSRAVTALKAWRSRRSG